MEGLLFLLVAATALAGAYGMYPYHGQYYGRCYHDDNGIYYRDSESYVVCISQISYVQPCPPGTRNARITEYTYGSEYSYSGFCSVSTLRHNAGYNFFKREYSEVDSARTYEQDAKPVEQEPTLASKETSEEDKDTTAKEAEAAPAESYKPNPAPVEQYKPDPAPVEQYKPDPAPVEQYKPDPAPVEQYKPDPAPVEQYKPDPAPVEQYQPDPAPVEQYKPDPAHVEQYKPDPAPVEQYKPDPAPVEQYKPDTARADQYNYYAAAAPTDSYKAEADPPVDPAAQEQDTQETSSEEDTETSMEEEDAAKADTAPEVNADNGGERYTNNENTNPEVATETEKESDGATGAYYRQETYYGRSRGYDPRNEPASVFKSYYREKDLGGYYDREPYFGTPYPGYNPHNFYRGPGTYPVGDPRFPTNRYKTREYPYF